MENLKDTNMSSPEERITLLERKMREMEALVKGLTEELLDLKSIAMRLNKVSEEQRMNLKTAKPALAGTPAGAPGAASGSVTVRPRVPAARTSADTGTPERRAHGDDHAAGRDLKAGDEKRKRQRICRGLGRVRAEEEDGYRRCQAEGQPDRCGRRR